MIDEFLPVEEAKERPYRPGIGLDRLSRYPLLHGLVVGVIDKLGPLPEGNDKPSQVVGSDSIDVLVIAQIFTEVANT